jgi:hypothetical protein
LKVCGAGKEPWHAIHPLANGRVRSPYRPFPRRQQTRDPHRVRDSTAFAGEKKRKRRRVGEDMKKKKKKKREEKKTRMHYTSVLPILIHVFPR